MSEGVKSCRSGLHIPACMSQGVFLSRLPHLRLGVEVSGVHLVGATVPNQQVNKEQADNRFGLTLGHAAAFT